MKSPLILRVFRNNQLVEVKQFDQEQIVIGHDAEVHLDLDAEAISPIHCLIELRDNGYYICDLGSQTGTFKNGQAILDESISSGDEITLGPFKIIFYVGVPKPKAAPAAGAASATSSVATATSAKAATSEAPAAPTTSSAPAPSAIPTAATPTAPASSVTPAAAPEAPVAKVPEAKPAPAVSDEAKTSAKVPEQPAPVEAIKVPEAPAKIPEASRETASARAVQKPEIRNQGNKSLSKKKRKGGTFAPVSDVKDLKDYLRPGKGATLEVIVAWKERILTTYHFKKKGMIRVAEKNGDQEKNLIQMPPGFAPKNWPLIEISSGVKINTTPEMRLELVQGDETLSLETLIKAGRAQRAGQGAAARLDQNEMICLTAMGSELSVYIRYAPQAPLVPMLPPLLLSASELTGVIMSIVMVAVLALYISATTPKDWEEQKQEDVQRVAQVIFNAPKPTPTPSPTPPPPQPKPTPVASVTPTPKPSPTPKKVQVADVKKEAQKKGKSANQASARPQTAARAAEVAPKPDHHRPKKFTSTKQGGAVKQGETAGANAQSSNKDVSKIGLFSAFGSGGNRDKLDKAYSGSGEVLGMGEKATGTSGFNENRAGDDLGSKFKDSGAGGKGTATQGIAGIGTHGRSSGQSAYGAGEGFGNKTSVAIEPGGAEEDFAGTIDREAVRRVIRAKLQEVKSCYERVLNTLPKGQRLEGKVVISWQIVERGAAKQVRVKSSTLGNSTVENCIRDRLGSWTFPEPPPGMIAEVAYPFVLNQAN